VPDAHRTCVYRTVQEALTNCIRHAHAQSIAVTILGHDDQLDVSIADDGTGMPAEGRGEGLGLRGIEERVRELHGTMTMHGAPGQGTTLAVRLPLPAGTMETALARAAG
jgi:signal transduction histidine kinase